MSEKTLSWKMFDRIAKRYDFLNHFLSLGQDYVWRRKLLQKVPKKKDIHLLDLATGTGDVALTLVHQLPQIKQAVGVDMSGEMLKIAQKKVRQRGLSSRIQLHRANATNIPYKDEVFDLATIAFGIRNVDDVSAGLGEMFRVLKSGGRVLILEFSLPSSVWFRKLYLFYFRHILPRIGGFFSGDSYAYSYLNRTVETFPYGEDFLDLMREVGFENVQATPLTMGIASIYQGEKC